MTSDGKIIVVLCIVIVIAEVELEVTNTSNIHKVAMTQKGYIQFMKYKVDVPPLSQFTFCIWMMSQNLTYAHPILSYSKNERDRYVRARVSAGGRRFRTSILEQEVSDVVVDLRDHIWYHMCHSWDKTTGRWQAYLNGRLVGDGINSALRGSVIPGGGDIVVGQEYTDFDKGLEDGIEGEIFGFNMILSSTTEEPNHKYYHKDSKDTSQSDTKTDIQSSYVRLVDLQTDKTASRLIEHELASRINVVPQPPDHQDDFQYSLKLSLRDEKPTKLTKSINNDEPESTLRPPISGIPFWNAVNQAGREGRFKGEIESLALTNLPIYETPPPALPAYEDNQKSPPSFEVLYSQQNFKGNQWYDQNDYFPGELLKTWKFKRTNRDKHRHNRVQHRPHHRPKHANKDLYPYPSENLNVYVADTDHSIFKRDTREKNVKILNPNTVLFYPASVEVHPRAESSDYTDEIIPEDRLKNHNFVAKGVEDKSYEVLYSRLHYTGGKRAKPNNRQVKPTRLPQSISDKINEDRFNDQPGKSFVQNGNGKGTSSVDGATQFPNIHQHQLADKEPSIYVFDEVNVNNHNVFNRWNKKYPEEVGGNKSPKSAGRKLVELGYKKCLFDRGAPLARDAANLISWTLTPVRVFGGATIKSAAPNCARF